MNERDLAAAVERAVLAVGGVRAVYRAGSLVGNLMEAGATALGIRPDTDPVVSVSVVEGAASVDASIGITYSAPAHEVLRAVRASVAGVLQDAGFRPDRLVLTIAHVQSRES